MTAHYHRCNLCPADAVACESDQCWTEPQLDGPGIVLVGKPRACERCESILDDVAEHPTPRGELGIPTIVRVVSRATRAALSVAQTRPEDAADKFAEHVDGMRATSGEPSGPSTWARLGAIHGAKAAWAWEPADGPVFSLPAGVPPGESAECYMLAWNDASSVVLRVRMEVANRG